MSLTTQYEFTLPRGYVDREGGLHRNGLMRLATARDELEPLRDPTVQRAGRPAADGADPGRVVQTVGQPRLVTPHEIEGLFAADLAFLQDFYGVINFGNQQEYEELLAAQAAVGAVDRCPAPLRPAADRFRPISRHAGRGPALAPPPSRARVEEIPRVPV